VRNSLFSSAIVFLSFHIISSLFYRNLSSLDASSDALPPLPSSPKRRQNNFVTGALLISCSTVPAVQQLSSKWIFVYVLIFGWSAVFQAIFRRIERLFLSDPFSPLGVSPPRSPSLPSFLLPLFKLPSFEGEFLPHPFARISFASFSREPTLAPFQAFPLSPERSFFLFSSQTLCQLLPSNLHAERPLLPPACPP